MLRAPPVTSLSTSVYLIQNKYCQHLLHLVTKYSSSNLQYIIVLLYINSMLKYAHAPLHLCCSMLHIIITTKIIIFAKPGNWFIVFRKAITWLLILAMMSSTLWVIFGEVIPFSCVANILIKVQFLLLWCSYGRLMGWGLSIWWLFNWFQLPKVCQPGSKLYICQRILTSRNWHVVFIKPLNEWHIFIINS